MFWFCAVGSPPQPLRWQLRPQTAPPFSCATAPARRWYAHVAPTPRRTGDQAPRHWRARDRPEGSTNNLLSCCPHILSNNRTIDSSSPAQGMCQTWESRAATGVRKSPSIRGPARSPRRALACRTCGRYQQHSTDFPLGQHGPSMGRLLPPPPKKEGGLI